MFSIVCGNSIVLEAKYCQYLEAIFFGCVGNDVVYSNMAHVIAPRSHLSYFNWLVACDLAVLAVFSSGEISE